MDTDRTRIENSVSFMRENSPHYKQFPKIDMALEYSNKNGFLPVWSADREDDLNPASKFFLVASYYNFIASYRNLEPIKRNWYEIIRPIVPCHLHIDSEVTLDYNKEFDAIKSESLLFKEIFSLLKELHIIESDQEHLVHTETLDSSNAKKYSKHFIIKIEKKMFMNNFHVGAFMRTLVDRVSKTRNSDLSDGILFFTDVHKTGAVVVKFFADMAIYTLNRNFRIYGSSKRTSGYRPLLLQNEKDDKIFKRENLINTLIQYINPENQPEDIIECLEVDGSVPVSRGNSNIKTITQGKNIKRKSNEKVTEEDVKLGSIKRLKFATTLPSFNNQMIAEIEKMWGEGMVIINSKMDSTNNIILFETRHSGCRMKREYENSPTATHVDHIFFQADLKKKTFVQKCFSQNDSCKKFRQSTEEYPFSNELTAKIEEYTFSLTIGEPAILASTVIQVYNIRIILSDDIMS